MTQKKEYKEYCLLLDRYSSSYISKMDFDAWSKERLDNMEIVIKDGKGREIECGFINNRCNEDKAIEVFRNIFKQAKTKMSYLDNDATKHRLPGCFGMKG